MRVTLPSARSAGRQAAFTLIEMLVVIIIIGILASVGLPALKGFSKSDKITAADRQLLDDIANARQLAIANHTDVYMLFMFPTNWTFIVNNMASSGRAYPPTDTNTLSIVTNMLTMQYTAYALYSTRTVGDQPGQYSPQYLTPWRRLPDGMFIAASKFGQQNYVNGVTNFDTNAFPFPLVNSNTVAHPITMPYIQFTYQGQLATHRDRYNSAEVIPLARGSIMTNTDLSADVLEIPPNNDVTLSNEIRIDWLTGRARVEQPTFQ